MLKNRSVCFVFCFPSGCYLIFGLFLTTLSDLLSNIGQPIVVFTQINYFGTYLALEPLCVGQTCLDSWGRINTALEFCPFQ